MLKSFDNNIRVAVFGASGGIGGAFVEHLVDDPHVARVFAYARQPLSVDHDKVTPGRFDYSDASSIAEAADHIADDGPLHLVIVATGILHDASGLAPEKSWNAMDADALEKVFRINTIGPALVAKHFLPLLPRERRSVFAALSARVGSISDNGLGGWYAYRASKAALNMILKTASIELARKRKDAICIGLHPGTVDSDLSKPFQSGVVQEKLFTPDFAAGKLLEVIDRVRPEDSGQVFAWDGSRIPF